MKISPFFDPFDFEKEFEKLVKGGMPQLMANTVSSPSMDVYKKKNDLIVEMAVPGIEADNVEVEIDENNVLNVKGSSKKKSEVDDKNYYKKEISYGSFYRSIMLPKNIKADKAKAETKDGMLQVIIPLQAPAKSKSVKVEEKKSAKKTAKKVAKTKKKK